MNLGYFLFVAHNQILSTLEFTCKDEILGFGKTNDETEGPCVNGKEGHIQYKCEPGGWKEIQDNCVVEIIKDLEAESQVIYPSNSENSQLFIMFLNIFISVLCNVGLGCERHSKICGKPQ